MTNDILGILYESVFFVSKSWYSAKNVLKTVTFATRTYSVNFDYKFDQWKWFGWNLPING